VTTVQVGPTQGEITVIDSGVAPGAKVVVDGADRLRDGAKVELATREPAAPEAGQREPGGLKEGSTRQPGARNPRAKSGA
jgi:multidrug efflux system membrane fusion protein